MTQKDEYSEPLVLPRITKWQAQARSLLLQRIKSLAVHWAGVPWNFSLISAVPPGPIRVGPGDWLLSLDWSGLPFDVVVPQEAAQGWLRARFPRLDIPATPPALMAALVEVACGSLLQHLGEVGRVAVILEKLLEGPGESRPLMEVFAFELSSNQRVLRGQIGTNPLGLSFLADLASPLEPVKHDGIDELVPINLLIEIGRAWLSLDELKKLSVRDTILLDQKMVEPDGQFWLGQGLWGLRVRRDDRGLRVMTPLTKNEWTSTDGSDLGLSHSELGSLSHMPLRVVFDIGDLTMTLGELKSLQIGQCLTLSRPLSSAVHVRVNGALLGTGELIDIDGELGVTLTSLFQRSAQKPSRGVRATTREQSSISVAVPVTIEPAPK